MFKKLFNRSWILASEVGDSLHHLYRWHQAWSNPSCDRVLDMYALEDRVLFNIAPIVNAAALQAGAGAAAAGMEQNAQVSAPLTSGQLTVVVEHAQAGQETSQDLQASENLANNSTTTLSTSSGDQERASNPDGQSDVRHVDFALVDKSLQNLDLLLQSLKPETEVCLYDDRQTSPADILNTLSDWAKTNNAQIDSLSILSHGALGSFDLGNEWLNSSNLGEFAQEWSRLGSFMAPGGEINIFGCNLAAGDSGRDLIDNIGQLTGSVVFASIDDTGYGGDWILEASSSNGNVSAWQNPLNTQVLEQYQGLLAVGVINGNTDVGSPAITGSSSYNGDNGLYTIAGAGSNIGGTSDQFQFAYSNINGDGSIIGRIASIQNTDPNAKSGVMFRDSTAADASYAMAYVDPSNVVHFDYRAGNGAVSVSDATTGTITGNVWLKLTRSGSAFSAYYSTDGASWTQVGSTRTLTMNSNAIAGLAVCSANAGQLNTSTFDKVSLLTGNWISQDVGNVVMPGGTSIMGNAGSIEGAGDDIWNNADAFHFDYQSLSGDSSMVVRISSLENTNVWAKAGLMFRQSTAADSPFVLLAVTPGNGIAFQSRSDVGGWAWWTNGAGGSAPMWLQLTRTGDLYTGYYSADGSNWTQIGNVWLPLGSNANAGLALTSHNSSTVATATFDNLRVNQTPVLGGIEGSALQYTAMNPAVPVSTSITCTDVNSPTINRATIKISGNYVNGEDLLSFTNTAAIAGSWDAASGTLTLTGVDTVANYQTALRSVKFQNTQFYPNTSARTVSYSVSDGLGLSNTITRNISLSLLPNVRIIESGGSTDIAEGAATDTYTVQLTTQPTSDVTVTFINDGHINTSAASLIFTASNWNTPQTVTVFAVDDNVLEGFHTGTIIHTVSSADTVYNGKSVPNVTAHITDNDGIIVSPVSGLTTSEVGGTAQFIVVLERQPTANVTIGINSLDATEGTVSTSSLTFTPTNWNVAQMVTVTGVDDFVVDGIASYTINIAQAVSTDPIFNGVKAHNVAVANMDNDMAGVTLTPTTGLTTTLNGGTAEFTAVLTSQPTSEVVIYLNSSDTSQGVLNELGAVIANYRNELSTTQGQNNWYYGYFRSPENVFREMTWNSSGWQWESGNGAYFFGWGPGGGPTDTEWAVVRYVVEESGTFRLSGNLNRYNWGNGGDGVTGRLLLNGNQEWFGSTTGTYDPAGVPISADLGLKAGDTLDFCLDPNHDAGWDWTEFPIQLQKIENKLIFTPSTWNIPQTVTVTGVNDQIDNGNVDYRIISAAVSSDQNYNAISISDVNITNLTYDISSVKITESGGSTNVKEGGYNDYYTVRLTSQPTADVTVTITPDRFLSVSQSTLTFTTANWNTAQTINVTALEDDQIVGLPVEGPHTGIITHSASSDDPIYNGMTVADVVVQIADEDPPGVVISSGDLTTSEDRSTTQFTVALATRPTSDVTVTFNVSDSTEGAVAALGEVVANFGRDFLSVQGNNGWYCGYYPKPGENTFQEFTLQEGRWSNGMGTMLWGAGAAGGPGGDTGDWLVIRYVAQETGTFRFGGNLGKAYEGGDGVTGRLLLNNNQIWSQAIAGDDTVGVPIAVDVNLNAGDILDFAIDPNQYSGYDGCGFPVYIQRIANTVTFTPSNWNFPQAVTLTGISDGVADGNITYKLTSTVTSSDPKYNAISLADVDVTNIDQNTPTLIMPPMQSAASSLTFSEANGNPIRVQNVDTSVNPLRVQLTAINGQVSLGNIAGLTFIVGDGSADSSLEFIGSADAVNAAFEGMQFVPTTTAGNLQIAVNSQGYSESSGPQMATSNVGILIINPQIPNDNNGDDSKSPSDDSKLLPGLNSLNADELSQNSLDNSLQAKLLKEGGLNNIGFNSAPSDGATIDIVREVDPDQDALSMRDRYQTLLSHSIVQRAGNEVHTVHQPTLNAQLLWKAFDAKNSVTENAAWLNNITVGTAIGLGAGLSAGYILCGALLTSTVATLPLCHMVDPLPILDSWEITSKKGKLTGDLGNDGNLGLEESLESLVS